MAETTAGVNVALILAAVMRARLVVRWHDATAAISWLRRGLAKSPLLNERLALAA